MEITNGNQKMTNKKLPSDFSTEELLEQLESEETTDIDLVTYADDIPYFFAKFNLRPGTHKIKNRLLYELYKLFSHNPVKFTVFCKETNKYVENKKTYLLLNVEPLEIAKLCHIHPNRKRTEYANHRIKAHIEAFISHHKLTKSKKWVSSIILFDLYKKFGKTKGETVKINHLRFNSYMRLIFEYKKTRDNHMFFGVDCPNIKEIKREYIQEREKRNAEDKERSTQSEEQSKDTV